MLSDLPRFMQLEAGEMRGSLVGGVQSMALDQNAWVWPQPHPLLAMWPRPLFSQLWVEDPDNSYPKRQLWELKELTMYFKSA